MALKSVHLWQLTLINNHKIIGMSTIKIFSRNDLEQINNADDLKISPFREDGKTYGTPTWIWNVVIEDNLYVRAYNGIHSRWYQSAMKQKAGRIHAAGKIIDVHFEPAEGEMNEAIDKAYKKKYSSSPYLFPMICESAKAATVRVTPAGDVIQRKKTSSIHKMALLFVISGLIFFVTSCNNHKNQKTENNMETSIPKISDFPLGEENTGYAQYFSGKSWLAPLTSSKDLNVPMHNVTFEPGCRNNWHSHTGGQLLIAVGGVGYYQERGKAAVRMEEGTIIEIEPNVEHWHGAAPDSWFSHLAITGNPQTNQNTWLEPVSDEEYAAAVK